MFLNAAEVNTATGTKRTPHHYLYWQPAASGVYKCNPKLAEPDYRRPALRDRLRQAFIRPKL